MSRNNDELYDFPEVRGSFEDGLKTFKGIGEGWLKIGKKGARGGTRISKKALKRILAARKAKQDQSRRGESFDDYWAD